MRAVKRSGQLLGKAAALIEPLLATGIPKQGGPYPWGCLDLRAVVRSHGRGGDPRAPLWQNSVVVQVVLHAARCGAIGLRAVLVGEPWSSGAHGAQRSPLRTRRRDVAPFPFTRDAICANMRDFAWLFHAALHAPATFVRVVLVV